MDFSKLRLGELVAGAAGVLLLIVMFLSWYGIGGLGGGLSESLARSSGLDPTLNAWQAFGFIDLLLFLTALGAIAAAVVAMTQRSVALPVAASVIVTALGLLAALLVLFRLVNEPGPDELFDIRVGAYLGLLLCAAITLGGFMSMRDEGASFSQAANDLQGRGGGAQPGGDIPTQPAPPATGAPAGGPTPPPSPPPATSGGQPPPPSAPPGQPPAGT